MRFAAWLLAGLLFTAATATAQDPASDSYQVLFQRGLEAITKGRYDEGITAFEKCLQLDDADSVSAYNLACCYALKGLKDEALKWLRQSFELGFTDGEHTAKDSDLESLREEPGFRALVEEMKAAAEKNAVRDYELHVPAGVEPGKPAPLLVALHGANGNTGSMMALWKPLADESGTVLLAVRGTVRVTEGAYRWDERSEATVLSILREVQAKQSIDPRRVYLTGSAQGAYTAYAMALHSPDLFRGIVSIGGIYPAHLEYNFPEAKKHGLGIFVIHGVQDLETIGLARAAAEKLTESGVVHALYEHPGGRDIPREEWPALRKKVWEFLQGL